MEFKLYTWYLGLSDKPGYRYCVSNRRLREDFEEIKYKASKESAEIVALTRNNEFIFVESSETIDFTGVSRDRVVGRQLSKTSESSENIPHSPIMP